MLVFLPQPADSAVWGTEAGEKKSPLTGSHVVYSTLPVSRLSSRGP